MSAISEPDAGTLCRQTVMAGGVVVLVPGLLAPAAAMAGQQDQFGRLLDASHELQIQSDDGFGIEALLAASLGTANLPSAIVTYRNDFSTDSQQTTDIAPDDSPADSSGRSGDIKVLRADPAFQQIDMHNATLADPEALDLSADEASLLVSTLNEHFVGDGLRFEQRHPQRWYAVFDNLPNVETKAPGIAVGQDVAVCKPTGADARAWRSKLAEIEMLLFEHPVNTDRQSRGLLPVNTLWLWGEGKHVGDEAVAVDQRVSIASDNFYSQSVSKHLKLSHMPLTQLESIDTRNAAVIAVKRLKTLAVTADEDNFHQALTTLNESLGRILWRNFKANAWPEILLWCGGSRFFYLKAAANNKAWPLSMFSVWRKPSHLSDYIETADV